MKKSHNSILPPFLCMCEKVCAFSLFFMPSVTKETIKILLITLAAPIVSQWRAWIITGEGELQHIFLFSLSQLFFYYYCYDSVVYTVLVEIFLSLNNLWFARQISDISPVGTVAFLYEEESLLVRIRNGWQYISVIPSFISHSPNFFSEYLKKKTIILLLLWQMGSFVPLPTTTTTTVQPSTLKPFVPGALDNMVNFGERPSVRRLFFFSLILVLILLYMARLNI